MLTKKVLEAYQDGSDVNYITECFNITHQELKNILLSFKEDSRVKKTFSNEFKAMIAERDINGVPRRQIATELEINFNTVKKACEQFGQAIKEKATSDKVHSKVDVQDLKACPSCKSKEVNKIESITMIGESNINTTGIYCMECGDEFFEYDGGFYRINFEYLEE